MRVRTVPIAASLVAGALAASMALTGTTALASTSHSSSGGSHSKTVTIVKGNCNAVNGSTINHCTTVSHSHGSHGHSYYYDQFGHRHDGILEGVGDIVGGLLGAL
jgi:hypothetical protein